MIEDPRTRAWSDSVRKERGQLALAEWYPENWLEPSRILETFIEWIPRPRRWPVFDELQNRQGAFVLNRC
jgi:hypothetical protein